jgi:hypothetical protein
MGTEILVALVGIIVAFVVLDPVVNLLLGVNNRRKN